MASVRDALAYCCIHYPRPVDLTVGLVVKILYLADWRSAIQTGAQITPTAWQTVHFVLSPEAVLGVALKGPDFAVTRKKLFGPKNVVVYKGSRSWPTLTVEQTKYLNLAIKTAATLDMQKLSMLVYSTYPFLARASESELDLVSRAKQYTRDRELLQTH